MIAGLASLTVGCAQTSRVSDEVTSGSLATTSKAVAVMRLGSDSPACRNVSITLGRREPNGYYRRGRTVNVVDVRSPTDPPIAEVELDAGEYHVVGFVCASEKGAKVLSDKADSQTYRNSLASFSLAPGEIVNVGFLSVNASHVGRSAFGRPLRVHVRVTDWPLDEIDRYKARRPAVYQQMTTRLMTVMQRGPAPPDAEDCARLAALKAEGKIANLPPVCAPAHTGRARVPS
jgi:hypothetical protein